jgi:hypothetical protein
MVHSVEHLGNRASFDNFPGIHDIDTITDLPNQLQVVRDVEHTGRKSVPEFSEEIDNPSRDSGIERSRRFVKEQ